MAKEGVGAQVWKTQIWASCEMRCATEMEIWGGGGEEEQRRAGGGCEREQRPCCKGNGRAGELGPGTALYSNRHSGGLRLVLCTIAVGGLWRRYLLETCRGRLRVLVLALREKGAPLYLRCTVPESALETVEMPRVRRGLSGRVQGLELELQWLHSCCRQGACCEEPSRYNGGEGLEGHAAARTGGSAPCLIVVMPVDEGGLALSISFCACTRCASLPTLGPPRLSGARTCTRSRAVLVVKPYQTFAQAAGAAAKKTRLGTSGYLWVACLGSPEVHDAL